jgi:hypothetical protein
VGRPGIYGRRDRLSACLRDPRSDWFSVKRCIDLAAVATDLLGAPQKRGGAGRLWWLCPLHPDRNPSFCITPGRSAWRCFGCGARGDAADLLMRVRVLTFAQAREALTARGGDPKGSGRPICVPLFSPRSGDFPPRPPTALKRPALGGSVLR